MPEDQEEALREHAKLHALAARAFQERFGEWPSEPEDLDPYVLRRPPSEKEKLRIQSMEAGDEAFTMSFVFGHPPTERSPDQSGAS